MLWRSLPVNNKTFKWLHLSTRHWIQYFFSSTATHNQWNTAFDSDVCRSRQLLLLCPFLCLCFVIVCLLNTSTSSKKRKKTCIIVKELFKTLGLASNTFSHRCHHLHSELAAGPSLQCFPETLDNQYNDCKQERAVLSTSYAPGKNSERVQVA